MTRWLARLVALSLLGWAAVLVPLLLLAGCAGVDSVPSLLNIGVSVVDTAWRAGQR